MPVRPFRFIHATNLRLDQPLWGVGSITAEARRIAEDATLTALERIVDACLDHKVSFLLLTGNCFDTAHAYRARMALEAACERLAERNIEVFVAPGESDPPAAWANGFQLPPNVTIFLSRPSEPVAVVRDSEVLATVEPFDGRSREADEGDPSSALRIGLIGAGQHPALQSALASAAGESVNELRFINEFPAAARFGYLALGDGRERYTVSLPRGIAHDPGYPQPLDGRNTEAAGCSLIEVERSGQLKVSTLPTAIVRREEINLSLEPGQSWDHLAQLMQTSLIDQDPLPTERLWLVRWVIDADAALAASLADPAACQELCELVEAELTDDRGIVRHHEIEFRSHWSQWDEVELTGSVYEEFNTLIDEQLPAHVESFRQRLPTLDWPEAGWVQRVIDAGDRIGVPAVAAHARELARQQLLSVGKEPFK